MNYTGKLYGKIGNKYFDTSHDTKEFDTNEFYKNLYKKSIELFLTEISKRHDVPLDEVICGIMQNDLYVWSYNTGRIFSEHFKVLEIIKCPGKK